jgi:CheY-like chemotaxis protein
MSHRKWILLAEDNSYDADLALRALAGDQLPWDVLLATDGQEALDCLYRRNAFSRRPVGPPALVVLDLKMPRVDGLEVLLRVKADAQLRVIPVVMFTSSSEETDVARCYQLGANAYVVKPVDFRRFGVVLKAIKTFWMVANEPPTRSPDLGRSDAIVDTGMPIPNLNPPAAVRPHSP